MEPTRTLKQISIDIRLKNYFDKHFSNALIHVGFLRQSTDFTRRELQHSVFARFGRHLALYDLDLLAGEL
jgi:hypothetical protein